MSFRSLERMTDASDVSDVTRPSPFWRTREDTSRRSMPLCQKISSSATCVRPSFECNDTSTSTLLRDMTFRTRCWKTLSSEEHKNVIFVVKKLSEYWETRNKFLFWRIMFDNFSFALFHCYNKWCQTTRCLIKFNESRYFKWDKKRAKLEIFIMFFDKFLETFRLLFQNMVCYSFCRAR